MLELLLTTVAILSVGQGHVSIGTNPVRSGDANHVLALLKSVPDVRFVWWLTPERRHFIENQCALIDHYPTVAIDVAVKAYIASPQHDPVDAYGDVEKRATYCGQPPLGYYGRAAVTYALARYLFKIAGNLAHPDSPFNMDHLYLPPEKWPSGKHTWPWRIVRNGALRFTGQMCAEMLSFNAYIDPYGEFRNAEKYPRRRRGLPRCRRALTHR